MARQTHNAETGVHRCWLLGGILFLCVWLHATDACVFTGERLEEEGMLNLTCTCGNPQTRNESKLRLQSMSMNWYAGITKTNLVSMEYYLDEGVVVKPSKYANIDIRNKEFDPGLHYASLQLQINTTRIGSFDFECVVRGFDKQDNHKYDSLREDFSTTTTSSTTTASAPPANGTRTSLTVSATEVDTVVAGYEVAQEQRNRDADEPPSVGESKEKDDENIQMVAMTVSFSGLVIIVGIVVFIIARRRKQHSPEETQPPPYGPPAVTDSNAWDVMRQLLTFVSSTTTIQRQPAHVCRHPCRVTPTCRAPPLEETSPYAVSTVVTQSSDDTALLSDTYSDISFVNAPGRVLPASSSDNGSTTDGESRREGERGGQRYRRFPCDSLTSSSSLRIPPPAPTSAPPPAPTLAPPPAPTSGPEPPGIHDLPPMPTSDNTTRLSPFFRRAHPCASSSTTSLSRGIRRVQSAPRDEEARPASEDEERNTLRAVSEALPANTSSAAFRGLPSQRLRNALALRSRPVPPLPQPLDLSALDERVGSSEYLTPTPITGGNFTFREQRDPDSGGGEYTDDGPLSLDTVEIYASTDYVPVNGPVSMP